MNIPKPFPGNPIKLCLQIMTRYFHRHQKVLREESEKNQKTDSDTGNIGFMSLSLLILIHIFRFYSYDI